MDPQDPQELGPLTTIRYIGLGQLKVYLVSEDELRLIEGGGPSLLEGSWPVAEKSLLCYPLHDCRGSVGGDILTIWLRQASSDYRWKPDRGNNSTFALASFFKGCN